jgi:hypothetical protein
MRLVEHWSLRMHLQAQIGALASRIQNSATQPMLLNHPCGNE